MQTKWIFLQEMPRRSFAAKLQMSDSGFEVEKDQVIVDASGDRILKLLFINCSLKSRAIKAVNFDK